MKNGILLDDIVDALADYSEETEDDVKTGHVVGDISEISRSVLDKVEEWLSREIEWAKTKEARDLLPGVDQGTDSPFINYLTQVISFC